MANRSTRWAATSWLVVVAACGGEGDAFVEEGTATDSAGLAAPPVENAMFGLATQYDTGTQAAVGIAGDTVVEAHRNELGTTLYHHVGTMKGLAIEWGPSFSYDSGTTPAIATSADGTVVEVHKSGSNSGLFYHVGTVDRGSKVVRFGPSVKYDSGVSPRIALTSDGWVIEVHKSEWQNGLWTRVGKVDRGAQRIDWGGGVRYDSGIAPTVAVTPSGVVVEAHAAGSGAALWSNVGSLDRGAKRVNFGGASRYDSGSSPSLAADGAGRILEVHSSEGVASTLWRRMGTVVGNAVQWGPSESFDTGASPQVAAAGDLAVHTHVAESGRSLWSSSSLVVDRARWMGAAPNLASKTLKAITLPGTHDSGAYQLTTDLAACRDSDIPGTLQRGFAETQSRSMLRQLEGGIRYFDLRPAFHPGTGAIHAYHAVIGPTFTSIVDELATFLGRVDRELVVLNVSSFCGFDDARHEAFVASIRDRIGPWLVTVTATELRSKTLAELTRGGPKVVLLYDDGYIDRHPEKGFFRESALDVFDRYANTDDFATMREDQRAKMAAQAQARPLFLLSWTLTFKTNVLDGNLHNLTKKANRELAGFLAGQGDVPPVNVLYVDYFEDARAVDLAITINRRR